MRKVTLESFCRDAQGSLAYQHEWSHRPFRVGGFVVVTNGHILVWREATKADRELPELTDGTKPPGDTRRANVLAMIARHPGADACRKPWPTTAPIRDGGPSAGFVSSLDRVYLPQKLRFSIDAVYRDRVARFGKSVGAEVLYATPRGGSRPVAFSVGEYLGLLMPLREH